MGNYEIVYYSKPNGREPLREFLESLSPKLSSEAFSDLATLQEMGPELRMPHSRHIRKGLFELNPSRRGQRAGVLLLLSEREHRGHPRFSQKDTEDAPSGNRTGISIQARLGKEAQRMTTLDEHLAEMMQDPEFAREWERLQPEHEVRLAILRAESELGITQSELAERCGMKQSALSRLETGKTSPTLKTLQQLAEGMGKKLVIQFV